MFCCGPKHYYLLLFTFPPFLFKKSFSSMFTHQDLNDMLQWGIQTLKELNIPISESICPMVELAKTHTHYGQCCRKV